MPHSTDAPRARRALIQRVSRVLDLVLRGRVDEARRLVRSGHTPDLFDAAALGDLETLATACAVHPIDALSHTGWTPLYVGVVARHPRCVEYLLGEGADPNLATDDAMLETPLHAAARADDAPMVRLLINGGADTASLDADGRDPASVAADAGAWDAAAELARARTLRPFCVR